MRKMSASRLQVMRRLADSQSIWWTPVELATYFPDHDWQHYSGHCQRLLADGLVERKEYKSTFLYKLTDAARASIPTNP